MKTYTRKDLVEAIEASGEFAPETALNAFEEVLKAFETVLTRQEEELRIELRNFGVFEVKIAAERHHARNPRTGEIVYVPPRRRISFKPGKHLRQFHGSS